MSAQDRVWQRHKKYLFICICVWATRNTRVIFRPLVIQQKRQTIWQLSNHIKIVFNILYRRSFICLLISYNINVSSVLYGWNIQWTRQFRVIDNHGHSRVSFRKNLFFPKDIVFRYFDYPIISPSLFAASNLVLAVETWLTEVVITKCLASPLPGEVKVPEHYLHATAKTSIWSRNIIKTCTYYIYDGR